MYMYRAHRVNFKFRLAESSSMRILWIHSTPWNEHRLMPMYNRLGSMLCILIDLFLLYFLFPLSCSQHGIFVTSEKHRKKLSFRIQCESGLRYRFCLIFMPAHHRVVCSKHLSKLLVFLSGSVTLQRKLERSNNESTSALIFHFEFFFFFVSRPENSLIVWFTFLFFHASA